MESRLHHDLGNVRVHRGNPSQAAATLLGAHALTIGNDIYLGADTGRTPDGQDVLRHEIAHAVQQRPWTGSPLTLSRAGDADEQQAALVARGRGSEPNRMMAKGARAPGVMSLPLWAAALIAGELACMFGFYFYALNNLFHKGDKWLHCWTSCKIATYCPPIPLVGQAIAALIGALKELADIVIGAAEVRDMKNNLSGIACSFDYGTSCDDCCSAKLAAGELAAAEPGTEPHGAKA